MSSIFDRFRTAEVRKQKAIADADAAAARLAARRRAELDAESMRARTRNERFDDAVARIADLIEPLSIAIEALDLDWDDVCPAIIRASRIADERRGVTGLHDVDVGPTAERLGAIFTRDIWFIRR